MMVTRVRQRAGLKPHRIAPYMASDDPDFELKAADIIGLYVKPPQHAPVFYVDEKTAIQALDRLDPPLSPGRLERHGFQYYRHRTLSLYAALNARSGEVAGKTAARHTSQEFVAFIAEVVANQPRGKAIHLVADNLSTHETKRMEQFLVAHPRVHLHYAPTYSLLAQSGRKLVCRDRTRCYRPQDLHPGQGLAHALYLSLQCARAIDHRLLLVGRGGKKQEELVEPLPESITML